MLVNLSATVAERPGSDPRGIAINLKVQPALGVTGAYSYLTNIDDLLQLLRRKTELRKTQLDAFTKALLSEPQRGARLRAVSMSDQTLSDIGYFID